MLCAASGNVIVMIVAKANMLKQVIRYFLQRKHFPFLNVFLLKANEYFFFGSLMFLDMCLLTFIAYRYKYIDVAPRTPKMEDVVTTETNNSGTEIPNQGSRKPSTTYNRNNRVEHTNIKSKLKEIRLKYHSLHLQTLRTFLLLKDCIRHLKMIVKKLYMI